jgi:hypothetical protein
LLMRQTHSDSHAPAEADPVDGDGGSAELWRYRRACREVDRLLDQGRLSEALRLNDEVRALFRTLFTSGELH